VLVITLRFPAAVVSAAAFCQKVMNYNYFLVVIIMLCIGVSYVTVHRIEVEGMEIQEEALITAYMNKAQNENLADAELSDAGQESENVLPVQQSSQEVTKILEDGSKVNTMYDGFGNKTETRCFINHPRLKCVILNAALDRPSRVRVFGQNGEIKDLPENMFEKAATASPDELANSAGIYATRQQAAQILSAQTNAAPTPYRVPLDNKVSIENVPTEQAANESQKSELKADGAETKSAAALKEVLPKANEKNDSVRRLPDERQ
jgi:hypothetical protein